MYTSVEAWVVSRAMLGAIEGSRITSTAVLLCLSKNSSPAMSSLSRPRWRARTKIAPPIKANTTRPTTVNIATTVLLLLQNPDKERSRDALVLAVGVMTPAIEVVYAVVTTRVGEGAAVNVEGTEVA